jgi:predicted RNA binding protein YcfA (HicA-like mRNA interferase family)
MAKLPILSGKDVVKILSKIGYVHTRTRGSHMIMIKQTEKGKKMIPIPNHKELAKGTLKAIMNQSEITLEELLKLV